jgi:DNA-binding NarL/FixJ family response regulator
MQKLRMNKQKKWIYYIEERRKEVAQMLAQGHTETDIARTNTTRSCKYHLQRR